LLVVNIDDNLHGKAWQISKQYKETRPKRRFRLEDDGFV